MWAILKLRNKGSNAHDSREIRSYVHVDPILSFSYLVRIDCAVLCVNNREILNLNTSLESLGGGCGDGAGDNFIGMSAVQRPPTQ